MESSSTIVKRCCVGRAGGTGNCFTVSVVIFCGKDGRTARGRLTVNRPGHQESVVLVCRELYHGSCLNGSRLTQGEIPVQKIGSIAFENPICCAGHGYVVQNVTWSGRSEEHTSELQSP